MAVLSLCLWTRTRPWVPTFKCGRVGSSVFYGWMSSRVSSPSVGRVCSGLTLLVPGLQTRRAPPFSLRCVSEHLSFVFLAE